MILQSTMEIPQWFMWLQGILTPILTAICGAALSVLWSMRQELTALNVKIEVTKELKAEQDLLWQLIRKLERRVDRIGNSGEMDVSDG